MPKLSVRDLPDSDLRGSLALVRVDFNVPLDESGNVADDLRIVAELPTIRYLLKKEARTVLVSHLGRPGGEWNKSLSLAPVSRKLAELLGREVVFVEEPIGDGAVEKIRGLPESDVFLLENVRFYPGEEDNDPEFSRVLSLAGDYFVNDAFGTAHRAHSSTVGVADYLAPAVSGLLMRSEIESLSKALSFPARPFVAIIGGAKVKGKIGVIRNLFGKVDAILIGGAMANTFFAAMGHQVGSSLVDEDGIDVAGTLLNESEDVRCEIILPQDSVVAKALDAGAQREIADAGQIPDGWMVVDIGPLTREIFRDRIIASKTVVWNGPMGIFEIEPFSHGTVDVAKSIAEATRHGAFTLLGGGDSVAAVRNAGLEKEISHISTGGGASLEFLAGRTLPGVEVLTERENPSQGGSR